MSRLAELRKERGMSLRDLSRKTGVSASQISRIETGQQDSATVRTMGLLAQALGVTIDDIAEYKGMTEAEIIKLFFENLDGLSDLDRNALAKLAGSELTDATGRGVMAFYKVLPAFDHDEHTDEIYFAVATWYCRQQREPNVLHQTLPLPSAARELNEKYAKRENLNAEEKKQRRHYPQKMLEWAGDSSDDVQRHQIYELLRRLWKNGVHVKFVPLLDDMLHWDADRDKIAQRWAKEYHSSKN